jgi:hypothetical protein
MLLLASEFRLLHFIFQPTQNLRVPPSLCLPNFPLISEMLRKFLRNPLGRPKLIDNPFSSRINMPDIINKYVLLRLAVSVLGQKGCHAWWDCNFMSEAGIESLDYNFPRSPLAAGFAATSLAAKRLHDDRIGRTGVTHLFRLEPDLEILIQRAAASKDGRLLNSAPLDAESMKAELADLAKGEIDSPEGPVQVGVLEHAATERGVTELARHYHAAFRLGHRIFPYFAAKRA